MRTLFIILLSCIFSSILASDSTNPKTETIDDSNPIFLNETYHTGFIPIPNKGSMFFWLFESRNKPAEDPLIIWLGGAPGFSSEFDIFHGNGPYRLNVDKLRTNPYSWNNIANVLYIDLLFGVGYSTGNYINRNSEEISSDFYIFLQEFLEKFPQYKGRDCYLAGQAYGGHYIPAIVLKIQKKGGINLKLKGIAIGNGAFSGHLQYSRYNEFAYHYFIIDWNKHLEIMYGFSICVNLLKNNINSPALVQCQVQLEKITGRPFKFNLYDRRWPCFVSPLCYELGDIEYFLGQNLVQQALGIYRPWVLFNQTVRDELSFEMMGDSMKQLSDVVQSGIQVLLYYGDQDFMYNWYGGETVVNNLEWSGAGYFQKLPYTRYQYYGEYKHLANLIFYKVINSGQMVSMNQPVPSLDMIEKFIRGWS